MPAGNSELPLRTHASGSPVFPVNTRYSGLCAGPRIPESLKHAIRARCLQYNGRYKVKPVLQQSPSYKWWVLITVSMGTLVLSLDVSILIVSFPRLVAVFQTDPSVISWLNIAYLIASQSLLMTLSRVGDAIGRKRVFMAGLAFSIVGLVMCGLSRSVTQLIIGRIAQGVGAAPVLSMSMAIVVAVFPDEQRGKALGILTSAFSMGLVAGPVLGGLILDTVGWQGIFLLRVPLAAASLIMAFILIKEQRGGGKFRLDIAGAASLLVCLSALTFFLNFGGKRGFTDPTALTSAGVFIVSLALFLRAETKAVAPIIDLRLFRRAVFAASTLSNILLSLAVAQAIFLIPFLLTEGLGYSSSIVGIVMAIVAIPQLLLSPVSGRLSDRVGLKGSGFIAALGAAMACLALILLSISGTGATYMTIAVAGGLVGASFGTFIPPNNSLLLGTAPREALGAASGMIVTARQIGISVGLAIAGTMYGSHLADHLGRLSRLDPGLAHRLASVAAFRDTVVVGVIIGAIAIPLCLVRGRAKS